MVEWCKAQFKTFVKDDNQKRRVSSFRPIYVLVEVSVIPVVHGKQQTILNRFPGCKENFVFLHRKAPLFLCRKSLIFVQEHPLDLFY